MELRINRVRINRSRPVLIFKGGRDLNGWSSDCLKSVVCTLRTCSSELVHCCLLQLDQTPALATPVRTVEPAPTTTITSTVIVPPGLRAAPATGVRTGRGRWVGRIGTVEGQVGG